MTDPTHLPRLYGEKEIGQILKRATELQHDEPSAPSADKMTLHELEGIAAEVGIDPTYLRRAALEVDTGTSESSAWTKWVGEEVLLVREIAVPGELREDGYERIVEVIERGTSGQGHASLLGRTITWRAATNTRERQIQITVSSRDGQTVLRLEENLQKFASELFGVSVAAFGGTVGLAGTLAALAGGAGLLAGLIPVGVIGSAYIGCRQIYRAIVKRRRRLMGELFGRVLTEVKACLVDEALPRGERPPELTAG